jgi:hypothetical protein
MNDKGHFITSLIKSAVRIISCIYLICTGKYKGFTIGFGLAEVLGIIEEVKDKRE